MKTPGPGKGRILVTAGPTRERIDPIRFLSNYATGTFGYAIAREAKRRGFSVVLVSGPTPLEAPRGVKVIRVETALEMRRAVTREFPKTDCVIMAAAVSDWRPKAAVAKIKRGGAKRVLELIENPDILAGLGRKKREKALVGFALETEAVRKNAALKLRKKNLDLIVANRHGKDSPAFGDTPTGILMIDRLGNETVSSGKSKERLAAIILDKVSRFLYKKEKEPFVSEASGAVAKR